MNKLTLFSSFALVVFLMPSCVQSKKFNYQEAYKFKVIKHQQTAETTSLEKIQEEKVQTPELVALNTSEVLQKEAPTELQVQLNEAQSRINQKLGLAPETKSEDIDIEKLKSRISSMDKKEKKALKKSLKADLKDVKKIIKEQQKTGELTNVQAREAAGGFLWLGIIIGSAGLLLLIIGAIAGIGVLTGIGAAALVAGLVLIIIDLA